MATPPITPPEGYQLDSPGLPEGYTLDPQTSVTGALGRGALNAIPFGTKGAAALEAGTGEGSYKDYLAQLDQLLQSDVEQHPIAHATGAVAGSIAPFAIPGVGEALGAETLAGRASIGAGIGALQGASQTRQPLTSPQGVGDIAKSTALGSILNPAVGALGDLVSNAAAKFAPELEQISNAKAVQSAGMSPKSLGLPVDELNELGQNMRDLDLVKGPIEERTAKAQDLLKQIGAQIGDIGADTAPLKDATPYVDELHKALQDSASIYGADANPEATIYRQGIANFQQPNQTFSSLQELKNLYGERAFDSFGNIKNEAAANVYRQIKAAMTRVVNDSPEDYQNLMTAYSKLKDINSGLVGQLQREQATGTQAKGFGLAGKLTGMVTGEHPAAQLGAAAALAPAHPFMALGALTPMLTNPQLMSNLAGDTASALSSGVSKSIAPAISNLSTQQASTTKIPPQYLPVFQKQMAGLTDPAEKEKQITITDYVLQSRDSNYSKAKEAMENQGY